MTFTDHISRDFTQTTTAAKTSQNKGFNESYNGSARALNLFIIKFPYNARSDWLEQRVLSENSARVDDAKLAFKFSF